MANGQALPVHFICYTTPYKNYNFQIDGASRFFRGGSLNNWSTTVVCLVFVSEQALLIGAVLVVIKV